MERSKTIYEENKDNNIRPLEFHELYKVSCAIESKEENKENEAPLKYTYEQILEQLGELQYYTENEINYVYYHVNGIEDEATKYLNLCHQDLLKLNKEVSKLKMTYS